MSDASSNANNPSAPHHAPGGLAGGADAISDSALLSMHEKLLQEKEEPREGFSIIPIILIFVGCVLTYMKGIDLAQHAGVFQWDVYDFNWAPGAETSGPVDMQKLGARVFKDFNCQNCHGPEGMGQPQAYPPLADSPWVHDDPRRAICVILLGMNGTVSINGNTVTAAMPNVGKGSNMSDLQIAAVLSYVRAHFGNHEPEVDTAIVAEVRSEIGGRNDPWKPEEILKKYPLGQKAPEAADAAPAAASGAAPAPAKATN